ncbi:MAG: endonuclease III domain-containing protein [Deferribacterota bacterium]|nr:endonuclease III domain-containing protein [Deferribacterota bacterium]
MDLDKLYRTLLNKYGKQHWWPADTDFEVVIGAILTQNTTWQNCEKAIENLKKHNLISPEKIHNIDLPVLKKLIKSAGFYNQKAQYLKNISSFITDNLKGNLQQLSYLSIDDARKLLLNIQGVGFETADTILLYAIEKPIFVMDAYTKRFISRFYKLKFKSYNNLQNFFMNNLEQDVELYKEYHALIVKHSKTYCLKKPLCNNCFINIYCNKNI